MVLGVLRMLSYHGASAMVAQDQAYETTAREGKKGLSVHMDTELILLGESLARRIFTLVVQEQERWGVSENDRGSASTSWPQWHIDSLTVYACGSVVRFQEFELFNIK